jgi:ammonium transporter, Amt family
MGVLDFAGGLVVHLSAGISGLVAAKVIGQRHGYGSENLSPFDLSLAVIGTGLLWVGWFGFNGGSALAVNPRAVMAIVATHLSACAGALTWGAIEWVTRRKPSVLGMISGAVAGLGTDHAGLRFCRAMAWGHHRHYRRPRVLLGLHLAQTSLQI